jgi:hypothetical protein
LDNGVTALTGDRTTSIRIAAAIAALMLAAAPAQAVITSITLSGGTAFTGGGTGQIIASPADVTNATLSGNNVFGFNERQNVSLGAVASSRPTAFLFSTLANGVVPQGRVSSHFFVFSPTAANTATGTITFNQNVIGVQRGSGAITNVRSDQLETGLTDFAAVAGLEANDLITRVNAKTISFSLQTTGPGQDMFRVITGVPEASTWAMMLAGFGMVGFGMRRRRTVVAA